MNLAWKDVRRQGARFPLTALGLGLLFAIVLAMGGIYRGMVEDATLLIDRAGADLWLVQRDTRGPFAERSVVPHELEDRAAAVEGVAWARAFSTATVQRERDGRPLRLSLVGLAWPDDRGAGLPLVAGRVLAEAHREMVADATLGLRVGEAVPLGDETYTVVGVTRGQVSSGGDGLAFVTLRDALAIQLHLAAEAQRAEREGRAARLERSDLADGALTARVRDDRATLPVLAPPAPNAVLVRALPGVSVAALRARFAPWADVTAYTADEQRGLLTRGVVEKARQQIGLFRVLLVIVSSIIVALILYGLTTARSREIALLKLMGARTGVVVGMILQQALMLGALGYAFAAGIGRVAFPHFPRRVVVTPTELVAVGALALAVCALASLAGIYRALRIPPTLVLAS